MVNHKTGPELEPNTVDPVKFGQQNSAGKVSVAQLAQQIGVAVERLVLQFKKAEIMVSGPDDIVAEADKEKLLRYLQVHHGAQSNQEQEKIVLRRASTSQLKFSTGQGGNKTVSVQVRKKRTYLKNLTPHVEIPEPVVPTTPPSSTVIEPVVEVITPEPVVPNHSTPVVENPTESTEQPIPAVFEEKIAPVKLKDNYIAVEDPEESKINKKKKKARSGTRDNDDINGMEKLLRHGGNLNVVLHQVEDDTSYPNWRRHKNKKSATYSTVNVQAFRRPTAPIIYEVAIPENISILDLAQKISVKGSELIKMLFKLGITATINQIIDQETAILIVEEMGHKAKPIKNNTLEDDLLKDVAINADLVPRSPIVTIMGHVDHGKTTLLDYIRQTKGMPEAGGITQHIGAYHVLPEKGGITFLDTPGHAAFSAMRARGAKITDIVILVVAADDGVMPQTIEALNHAKAAEVPIVVAITKIDKSGANIDTIKQVLSKHGLLAEEWGGDTMFVPVSAKTGENIDALLEAVLLQADILQLVAPITGYAKGIILEARLDKGRGPVASVLVQQGLLQRGDVILSGYEYGKVRAMFNVRGEQINNAGPSIPVEVLGWSATPQIGDIFMVVPDEKRAREVADLRQKKSRLATVAKHSPFKLEDILQKMGDQKSAAILNIVLKSDVQGSAEALAHSLEELSTPEITVKIISSGIGGINATDVNLAIATRAVIIGFNVRADLESRKLIELSGITARYHNVIYEIITQIKAIMSGYLEPEIQEKILGIADVRDIFRASKHGTVAGCLVINGIIKRNNLTRVLRNQVVVHEGTVESIRRFKEDVTEVRTGLECGISLRDYNDIKPGDKLEVFERISVKRTIN